MVAGCPRAPQRRNDHDGCAAGLTPHPQLFATRSPVGFHKIARRSKKGLFNLIRELRASGLDVGVPDTAVLDMPVELGLELVAAVGADALDSEGELLDDVSTKSMALTWLWRL